MTRHISIVVILLSLQGCNLFAPLRKSECNWAEQIITVPEDSLTRLTKEAIVAHNLKFAKFCK